jgi:hypothetical protein
MNAIRTLMDRDQFRALLHFADDTSAGVFGRMAGIVPAETDERLRALAAGEVTSQERSCLLEELADNPELLRRLAQYLQDRAPRECQ